MSISGNSVSEGVLQKNFISPESTKVGDIKSRTLGTGRASFDDTLVKAETNELFKGLDTVAEKLFRFPTEMVLDEYRNAVGKLLQSAESMLEVRSDFSVRRGTSKMLISKTNKKLRELEDVIAREGKRSRIMGITTEIRGCLLSLMA